MTGQSRSQQGRTGHWIDLEQL